MKVCIIDIGLGNIYSLSKCIENLGYNTLIAKKPSEIFGSDKIIFPGVGSFYKAMQEIKKNGWQKVLDEIILIQKKYFLGICIGMQVLSKKGFEHKQINGLSFINGEVLRLDKIGCKLTIPHIGWNNIKFNQNNPLFKKIKNESDFYFDHSYALSDARKSDVIATSNHDVDIVAAINKNNIFGIQFHPEKSSEAGIRVVKNFLEL